MAALSRDERRRRDCDRTTRLLMWRDASETIAAAAAGKRLSLTLAQRSSIHYHDRRKEIKKIFLHRRQKKIQLEKHADHSVRHLGLPVQEIWANAHETRESSFCSQSCLDLCLSISSQFTFLQPKIGKITKTPYFGGSRSFKVIDVDTTKKHVTSACYVKQHICAYLQPFSRWTSQYWKK